MVVGFTFTYAISTYLSPLTFCVWTPLRRGVRDTTLCDKVCQWLATGRCFSPGTPVSSTNKTDRHEITEILLKVALNTIKRTSKLYDLVDVSLSSVDRAVSVDVGAEVLSIPIPDVSNITIIKE